MESYQSKLLNISDDSNIKIQDFISFMTFREKNGQTTN